MQSRLGDQFFDPFGPYSDIEFEHHGEGWAFDEEESAPVTHGSIHVPGRRIPVRGSWRALSAPRTSPAEGESVPADRKWEDFRFHALSEVPDTDYTDMSSPFMTVGVLHGEGETPEREQGSSVSMGVAGRPVGVDLAGIGVDKPGYYPVDPPHSTVHTEGFWLGGRRGNLDPGVGAVDPPEPGAVPYQHEEDPDFPEGERIPTNLPFDRRGSHQRPGGLAAIKKVERWAQDPGGGPQGPDNPEFGTTTTDWVRERELRHYRMGSRQLAARSKFVNPIEQLTSPEGGATLSASTGKGHDYFAREMARFMEHLRGGEDEYVERGTHGQDFPKKRPKKRRGVPPVPPGGFGEDNMRPKRPNVLDPEQQPQKPENEMGEKIDQGFEGVVEGLAAAFAPKKVPAKRERPVVPMKHIKKGTEGMPWEQAGPLPERGMIEDAPNPLPDTGIPLSPKPEYVDERHPVHGQKTGRRVLKHPPGYEKPQESPKPSKSTWGSLMSQGSRSHFNDGHEGQVPPRSR